MGTNRFVAIWGSGGSGKTTLTIKIAKELSAMKKNVLIIHCDDETPVLPLLLPASNEVKSLGYILSMSSPKQNDVLMHCNSFSNNKYISLLGYRIKENAITYPQYTDKKAKQLFSLCQSISDIDYILSDCSSHTSDNILTAVTLEAADTVLRVCNADIKSLVYMESQKQLLQDAKFHYSEQLNVLNNVVPTQALAPLEKQYGKIHYLLPHCDSLNQQFHEQKLLEDLSRKDAKQFDTVINNIISEVFLNE